MRSFTVIVLLLLSVLSGVAGKYRSMDLRFHIPHTEETLRKYKHEVPSISSDELPESFDARKQWPNCIGLKTVQNQKQCGGCWAFAISSVMSDRFCIASNGSVNVLLSAEQLVSCCGDECTLDEGFTGCNGGNQQGAYEWIIQHGLVTGGTYESQYGCQPYVYGPCPGCNPKKYPTPKCVDHCTASWSTPYEQDSHYAESYAALGSNVENIMKEIYVNGPVSAGILVYKKFKRLEDEIYKYEKGDARKGGHAIKIIGWGRENNEDYWLIQNSWGQNWGIDGYGKIRRGTNEVDIESFVFGAVPKLDNASGTSTTTISTFSSEFPDYFTGHDDE